jgi:hypothetical protein
MAPVGTEGFSEGMEKGVQLALTLIAFVCRLGSYLLCHDDDLESRRVAFIIYLVSDTR